MTLAPWAVRSGSTGSTRRPRGGSSGSRSTSVSGPRGRPSCAGWRRGCGGCCPAAASSRFRVSRRSEHRRDAAGPKPAIVIGAHYDTLVKPKGFVGANNGAAGTAVVVGVARALARADVAAGSRAGPLRPVRRRGAGRRASRGEPRLLPLGPARLARVRQGASRARPARWSCSTTSATRALGSPARAARASSSGTGSARPRAGSARGACFPDYSSEDIVDDHSPFLRAGVPAVDLIDWRYHGHSLSDGLDKLSPASLDAVGETVAELATRLRAAR